MKSPQTTVALAILVLAAFNAVKRPRSEPTRTFKQAAEPARNAFRTIGIGGNAGDICRAWRQKGRRLEAGPQSVWRRSGNDDVTTCTPIDGQWPSADQFQRAYDLADSTAIPTTPFMSSDPDPCGPLAVVLAIQRLPSGVSSVACGKPTADYSKLLRGLSTSTPNPSYLDAAIIRLNSSAGGEFFSPRDLRYIWDEVCPYARDSSPKTREAAAGVVQRICGHPNSSGGEDEAAAFVDLCI